jgi:hypothetical protein
VAPKGQCSPGRQPANLQCAHAVAGIAIPFAQSPQATSSPGLGRLGGLVCQVCRTSTCPQSSFTSTDSPSVPGKFPVVQETIVRIPFTIRSPKLLLPPTVQRVSGCVATPSGGFRPTPAVAQAMTRDQSVLQAFCEAVAGPRSGCAAAFPCLSPGKIASRTSSAPEVFLKTKTPPPGRTRDPVL